MAEVAKSHYFRAISLHISVKLQYVFEAACDATGACPARLLSNTAGIGAIDHLVHA